jgi:hypothetical protein
MVCGGANFDFNALLDLDLSCQNFNGKRWSGCGVQHGAVIPLTLQGLKVQRAMAEKREKQRKANKRRP